MRFKKYVIVALLSVLTISVAIGQNANMTEQLKLAKEAAGKFDINLGQNPQSASFETEKLDDDTFRELKSQFETESNLRAIILVESGITWVFHRYDRWWLPFAWFAGISAPLVTLGIIRDNGALTGTGLVLGAIAGGVGYFTMEKSEVADLKNSFKGNSAVFIVKK